MLQLVVVQNGQHVGYGHAVVRAAGGLLSFEKAVLHHKLQRVGKVEGAAGDLGVDHVHMALEHNSLVVLVAWGGGLSDQNIVQRVPAVFQPPLLGKVHHIVGDGLLMEAGAGDGGDLFKKSCVGLAGVVKNEFHSFSTSLS